VHLVGFVMRIYHDARTPEPQIRNRNLGIGFCLELFLLLLSFNLSSYVHKHNTVLPKFKMFLEDVIKLKYHR